MTDFSQLSRKASIPALRSPQRTEPSSLYYLAMVGFLCAFGTATAVSGAPAMAEGANLEDSDKLTDLLAEADRERSRQRLLDYLQRLRSRPNEPTPAAAFPSFGSTVFDAQLAGYMAYVNAVGTPDILIVGSSRALQGIDPTELQAQLAGQGYPGLKVYNFSVNGATAQVVNFMLSELLPGELPPVVVWGDGSRAFNDGRRDRTWESLIASPGYQAILRGEKPVVEAALVSEAPVTEVTFSSAAGTVVSYEIDASTEEESSLTRIEDENEVNQNQFGLSDLAAQPDSITVRSDTQFDANLVGTRLNGLTLDGMGFSAVSDRFDPALYYQQFPQVSGQYDGAYSPFALQGAQTVALGEAANAATQRNAQLIFVNLPLSDSYLDDFRLYYEDRFRQFLQTESDRYGFEVVDLLQAWQGQPDLFADPSHINQHGAAAIAAQLAFDPALLLALRTRESVLP